MGDGSTLVNLRDTTNKLISRVLREGDGTTYDDCKAQCFDFLLLDLLESKRHACVQTGIYHCDTWRNTGTP